LLFLLLGLYIARFSWQVPLASDAERVLHDLRFEAKAARTLEQDNRIVLITYNDDTLAQLGKRSPLDRAMLARALAAIDAMHPRAIGIDILIDQAQPEDPELIRTLRAMRSPTYLAFASAAHNPDQILPWQEEFLRGFLRQAAPGPVRPASIRLETDLADGVIRRWPDQPRDLPPLLANAMAPVDPAFRDYRRVIDFRLPASGRADEVPVFTNLPIQFVAEFPEGVREMIQGRYVLIGGDIQDLDNYETPMTRKTGRPTKGLEVHAHMLAQLLDGRMPAAIPGWALWIAALGVVVAGALTSLLEWRGWRLALVLVFQIAFFGYLPFQLQGMHIDTLGLPAFGWGAGWLLAFVGVGTAARAVGSEQRRFAQSALGKYLPPDVANQIMRDPERLSLRGEKKQIFALFTDLEGFTKLSHAITPEQLSALLNRYLDLMSDTVLKHGGTIDKFVGDAVVAFWGAPIDRPDDGERAVKAAMAMFECGEQFRRSPGDGIPPIGCTRVGLHRGEAVVGNFGGEGRIQYTALGDGMNTAARLESANKALKTTILVSTQAREHCALDVFRPMGRVVLSGRATPCEVWEPVGQMDAALRVRLNALWRRYDDEGDLAALRELEAIAAEHKEDAALGEFVYRIREAGPGGHFVLGSK
ncbi:MAG TPA: adenylate/guanylate cyclase domain-containing protein, partial [Allosphingosinicella sp.]|nr:adenylate/guanylate cyclase domain-containing protein [Allosphingosinicella sp.]